MPDEYEIFTAHESDAEEILRLQYAAYQSEAAIYNNYSIQPLTQTLEQTVTEFHESTVLKAVLNGKTIGSVRATEKEDSVYIGKLMVLPEFQNRGIGKRLLQAIENAFYGKRYWLTTGDKSKKNLQLYEKRGYTRYKTEEVVPGLTFVYLEKQIIIRLVTENKKDFLPLLLLGDEQESQIDKYLERGDLHRRVFCCHTAPLPLSANLQSVFARPQKTDWSGDNGILQQCRFNQAEPQGVA